MSIKSVLFSMLESTKYKITDNSIDDIVDRMKLRSDYHELLIHGSNDFEDSKYQTINKIGINTRKDDRSLTGGQYKSGPAGIYAYPLDHIREDGELRYMTNADTFYVIKPKTTSNILVLDDVDQNEFDRCMDLIDNRYGRDTTAFARRVVEGKYGYWLFSVVRDIGHNSKTKSQSSNIQANVWRKLLGWDGISGKIYPNEPNQVVLFGTYTFDVIDTIKMNRKDLIIPREDYDGVPVKRVDRYKYDKNGYIRDEFRDEY